MLLETMPIPGQSGPDCRQLSLQSPHPSQLLRPAETGVAPGHTRPTGVGGHHAPQVGPEEDRAWSSGHTEFLAQVGNSPPVPGPPVEPCGPVVSGARPGPGESRVPGWRPGKKGREVQGKQPPQAACPLRVTGLESGFGKASASGAGGERGTLFLVRTTQEEDRRRGPWTQVSRHPASRWAACPRAWVPPCLLRGAGPARATLAVPWWVWTVCCGSFLPSFLTFAK